ncbi:MAG: tRNA (N(6)-L-threonylcarbamoyladenosine(37)-C(2))-methylthiotransferase MtaB [Actinobacteria bacterium]|nr:tRNA (N(6)-L-threonylcarbamoyladenosine(37)-C(2))-methylthiotransferase MtaB [Actinomycetota bacterium]
MQGKLKTKDNMNDIKNKKEDLNRFSVVTFGCKTNQTESDNIIGELTNSGLKLVEFNENPDFAVINTCTVTSASDKKARQMVRRIKMLNPAAKIIVTGCFVNFNDRFLKENNIDHVFTNEQKGEIADLIKGNSKQCKLLTEIEENLRLPGRHSRQFIKIQDGCEQRCSYCIVPYVRGAYRSETPLKIISDIDDAVKNERQEIVITGIHIGKYGIDFKDNDNFAIDDLIFSDLNLAVLLELITNKTQAARIRLSSIEINEITDELLDLMKDSGKIARHLHVPLQSGSSNILKKMGRPYDMDFFFKKINKIKKLIPDIALTTDIITGFPGESDEDFNHTLKACREINFSKIHAFKYSPRNHTAAACMYDQVNQEIKNKRSLNLRGIASELRKKYINLNKGKVLKVSVERINYDGNLASGMSENYIKIYFCLNGKKEKIKTGQIVEIKTDSVYLEGLKGSVI